MRLLVTGGAGFIGSNFTHYWARRHPGDAIVVLDALTYAGVRESLTDLESDGRIEFVPGDICDQGAVESLLAENDIDTIVNFAAESHNSLAVLDPRRAWLTNVLGTQALCEAAKRQAVSRLHHISTCEVFGDLPLDSGEAFTEASPYRPRTPYNASKAAADHVVRSYGETFGLAFTITNCCNNYGPFQFPEKLVPLLTTRALLGESLPLYASTGNKREWLHVQDHCSAIEAVLQSGRVGETYLVGSGIEATIMEIADLVLAAAGQPESLKTIVPDRPGHDRRYLLDSAKIGTELGWAPSISLAEGITATVKWYDANQSWWKPLLGRSPVNEESWARES